MDYRTVMLGQRVADSIPYECAGRLLPVPMTAKLAVLQASYKLAMKEFDDFMAETVKRLKKDGFDERTQKIQRMADIDGCLAAHESWKEGSKDKDGNDIPCPAKPTDEELKEAEEIRATKADYDKELEQLNTAYSQAYNEKLAEESKTRPKGMDNDLFESVIEMLGISGEITVKMPNGDINVGKTDFIRLLAENLVF